MLKPFVVPRHVVIALAGLFVFAIASSTSASAQNDADAPIPVAEKTPITKTPDKTYEFTETEPIQVIEQHWMNCTEMDGACSS